MILPCFQRYGTALATAFACLWAASLSNAEPAATTNMPAPSSYQSDWRWVKGVVFVPTKDVNEAQQWDEYDPV